jgi:hypothetical protein
VVCGVEQHCAAVSARQVGDSVSDRLSTVQDQADLNTALEPVLARDGECDIQCP